MNYYRTSGKTERAKCDNCGQPFRAHKYVSTDRDGDLHKCPKPVARKKPGAKRKPVASKKKPVASKKTTRRVARKVVPSPIIPSPTAKAMAHQYVSEVWGGASDDIVRWVMATGLPEADRAVLFLRYGNAWEEVWQGVVELCAEAYAARGEAWGRLGLALDAKQLG